ncbi:4-aminobutyrate--2-oxoglutarate transaminase [Corynebacterium aurimucosum]|uniref:4-aminobutyrate--2-oxoglutarate transaminase n=1 Tax=Corynebacterium guaraldiae TaxID=3051103 RepID=UPI0012B77941|nr:4-aminobutyrate--2-oxoglutarate transaminase [Corynebacterium guaraldiae]MCG7261456.1 4-aminobutyrate--2-oxoglutarate transaminase [Corynebacterium aurimucosum]MTE10984.1 4-aminobutyrate--2-oxoglutarate transaminase [Corynebacterium guaraldiae]
MQELQYHIEQSRHLGQQVPGPKSAALDERRKNALPAGMAPSLPGYVVDADGGILADADGNRFIDLASGIAVTSAGASNPAVVAAVQEAVAHFTHTSFTVSPYESYVAVAEKLNEVTPGDHPKKTALFNSGAEAVENAVKIARNYTGKRGVVVMDRAFHGRTNLTMAMTAKQSPYKNGFGPFAPEIYRAPMSYPLRDGLSGAEAAKKTITMIEQEVGATNLACVVAEPIQGEGGFVVPAEGYLAAIQKWCNDNDVVFIIDEIQAGMMRTGTWFASDHEGIVPDMVTIAKGIASGMPLSAVTGRAEIMDTPQPGGLGGTYTGNPVACAAALATFKEFEEKDFGARAQNLEKVAREELEPILGDERVADFRGRGAMLALEFVTAEGEPDSELVHKIADGAKAEGVLLLTCGLDHNVIRFLPSLAIPEDLWREALQVVVKQFNEYK